MKKILFAAFIVLLSPVVIAENAPITQNELKIIVQTGKSSANELVLAKNEENNLALWENLDLNKDGLISKVEAASSKNVFNLWNKLDLNKDEKIDTEEFAQLAFH